MPAEIDQAKCTGKKVCIDTCPVQAITFNEGTGKAKVDPDTCISCGACVAVCPETAITMD